MKYEIVVGSSLPICINKMKPKSAVLIPLHRKHDLKFRTFLKKTFFFLSVVVYSLLLVRLLQFR